MAKTKKLKAGKSGDGGTARTRCELTIDPGEWRVLPCFDEGPEAWWVARTLDNGLNTLYLAVRGKGHGSRFSGPFTQNTALAEARRLNREEKGDPCDGGGFNPNIPAWTAALLIGTTFGVILGYVFFT